MRYVPYIALREILADLRRKSGGLPKTVKGRTFIDEVIVTAMHDPTFCNSLMPAVLLDEDDYVKDGCRMYFPDGPELLRTLWRAKMDCLPSDVGQFPRSFSVAWPDDLEIEGVRLPGVLVWWGTVDEHRNGLKKFIDRYAPGLPMELTGKMKDLPMDERVLCISYLKDMKSLIGTVYRTVVPEKFMSQCMRSPEEMREAIGEMSGILTFGLNEEEQKVAYVLSKLVVSLMVYATACPDAVLTGWPDKFHKQQAGRGWINRFSPSRFTWPKGMSRDGVSPSAHWRRWHFRRYPVTAAGTRRQGLVFVSGCMVAADVDPKTVIDKGGAA